MKGIRRSLNKGSIGAPTPTFSSLPTAGFPSINPIPSSSSSSSRPLQSPAPPKRVIRATEAYRSRSPRELSFEEGDFFHVVSDEGGDDWFDAANPMTGARGLVPARSFQVLGRNVRETAQGVAGKAPAGGAQINPVYGGPSMQQQQQQAQSSQQYGGAKQGGQQGYIPTSTGPTQSTFISSPPISAPITTHNSTSTSSGTRTSRPPSQPAPKSQPLYGIVQYDFVAERADELDAKRGEPIIVIAQSNHEWFVAKPIGRLGGPGLIPVAFVEIQDMTTGKPVENVEELIRSAVVPKVEEWKKMTADYKSASIPLGRFDFADGSAPVGGAAGYGANSGPPPPIPTSPSARHQPSHYDDQDDLRDPSYPPTHASYSSPALGTNSGPDSRRESYGETGENRYSYTRERQQYGLVLSASVESFHQEEGAYWFHLRANFTTGASLILYRLYQDFYDFQIALMDEFPVEAGRVPPGGEDSGRPAERILPMMPGPTDFEDEVVCAQRVHDLSIYLTDLCGLPDRIRGGGLMYEFLVPRAGDVEVEIGNGKGDQEGGGAASIEGQYGELVEYLDQMDGQDRSGVEKGMERLEMNGGAYPSYGAQEQEAGSYSRSLNQYSPAGDGTSLSSPFRSHTNPPRTLAEQYTAPSQSYQTTYPSPPSSSPLPPLGTANQNVPFVKIKIFHRNTDDLIAIRVPPNISHAAILEKVRERLGNDVVHLRYREEVGSAQGPAGGGQVIMAGGARLIAVDDDEDLDRWIRGGSRLVLVRFVFLFLSLNADGPRLLSMPIKEWDLR